MHSCRLNRGVLGTDTRRVVPVVSLIASVGGGYYCAPNCGSYGGRVLLVYIAAFMAISLLGAAIARFWPWRQQKQKPIDSMPNYDPIDNDPPRTGGSDLKNRGAPPA